MILVPVGSDLFNILFPCYLATSFVSVVDSDCKFHTGTDTPVVTTFKSVGKKHRTEKMTSRKQSY